MIDPFDDMFAGDGVFMAADVTPMPDDLVTAMNDYRQAMSDGKQLYDSLGIDANGDYGQAMIDGSCQLGQCVDLIHGNIGREIDAGTQLLQKLRVKQINRLQELFGNAIAYLAAARSTFASYNSGQAGSESGYPNTGIGSDTPGYTGIGNQGSANPLVTTVGSNVIQPPTGVVINPDGTITFPTITGVFDPVLPSDDSITPEINPGSGTITTNPPTSTGKTIKCDDGKEAPPGWTYREGIGLIQPGVDCQIVNGKVQCHVTNWVQLGNYIDPSRPNDFGPPQPGPIIGGCPSENPLIYHDKLWNYNTCGNFIIKADWNCKVTDTKSGGDDTGKCAPCWCPPGCVPAGSATTTLEPGEEEEDLEGPTGEVADPNDIFGCDEEEAPPEPDDLPEEIVGEISEENPVFTDPSLAGEWYRSRNGTFTHSGEFIGSVDITTDDAFTIETLQPEIGTGTSPIDDNLGGSEPAPDKQCKTNTPAATEEINKLGLFNLRCNPDSWKDEADAAAYGAEDPGEFLQYANNALDSGVKDAVKKISGEGEIGWLNKAFVFLCGALLIMSWRALSAFMVGVASVFPAANNCDRTRMGLAAAFRGMWHFLGGWLGLIPESVLKCAEQQTNLACPSGIPDSGSLTTAYAKGQLDVDQWKFGLHMNGDCDKWFEPLFKGSWPVPNIGIITGMFDAKLISEEIYNSWNKRAGLPIDVPASEFDAIVKSTQWVPGPNDLIRLMVRDVADPAVVESEDLECNFGKKWQGKLKDLGLRQRIDEDTAKLLWYGHWVYPSNTQLYQCLHRQYEGAEAKTPDGKSVVTTVDDVRRVLEINDLAPKWVDRLIEISYNPLTRVDTRRAYEVGELDDKGVNRSYRVQGYNEEYAKILTEFTIVDSGPRKAKLAGKVTPDQARSLFLADAIPENEYFYHLVQADYKPERAQSSVEGAKELRKANDTKSRLSSAKKKYIRGAMSDEEYYGQLTSLGVMDERAQQIVARDRDIKDNSNKEIALMRLCKLVGNGIISVPDYIQRVKNLGFKQTDALTLAAGCLTDIAQKRAREMEQAIRQAIKDAEAAQAREDKARARAEREYRRSLPCRPRPKPQCETIIEA